MVWLPDPLKYGLGTVRRLSYHVEVEWQTPGTLVTKWENRMELERAERFVRHTGYECLTPADFRALLTPTPRLNET